MEHWNLDIISCWLIGAGCQIEKYLELSTSPPNCSKDSWKLLPLYWPSFRFLLVVDQKMYSKTVPCFMYWYSSWIRLKNPVLVTEGHQDNVIKTSWKIWTSWTWFHIGLKVYPPTLLCKLKLFLCFNPSFHYGLQKFLSRGTVKLGLQGRVKLGNSLFSCEIIMSGLMKPTEKFVPFYILAKNKKMFQRVVIAFPWDYPTNYMLWSPKDRVTEGQNSTFSKIFSLQFKLTHITRQKWMSYRSISTSIFYHFLPAQDWHLWHTLSHKILHLFSVQIHVVTVSHTRV